MTGMTERTLTDVSNVVRDEDESRRDAMYEVEWDVINPEGGRSVRTQIFDNGSNPNTDALLTHVSCLIRKISSGSTTHSH